MSITGRKKYEGVGSTENVNGSFQKRAREYKDVVRWCLLCASEAEEMSGYVNARGVTRKYEETQNKTMEQNDEDERTRKWKN